MKPKLAAAVLLGGVATVFSFLDSAGQALSDSAPAMAAKFDANNEVANQRLITLLLKQFEDPKSLAEAARMTQHTARTAPGLAPVLRSYALLVEANQLNGDVPALMQMASEFSKRDLPTQLWLIEQRAASGDIDGTLAYYDTAMQTNPEVRAILYPVLGRAVSDPDLTRPIAEMLRKNPVWAPGFYRSFAEDKEALTNFPTLMAALGDDAMRLIPKSARVAAALALMDAGQLEAAETVALFGMDAGNLSDFSNGKGRALPPFGWELVRSGTVSADVADDNSLIVEGGRGAGGVAARRLVRLQNGSFTITGTMIAKGATLEQLPRLHLACRGRKQDNVIVLPKAAGQGTFTFSESVSMPQCPFVEISIRLPGNFVDAPISAQITALGMQ